MSGSENELETLWPDDLAGNESAQVAGEPDHELAVTLLAAGCSQSYIRQKCGFASQRDCAAFCRDPDTRQAVELAGRERAQRLGKRALVKLEQLVSRDHTDLRAQVLAVRTALEVSGDLKRDHSPPVKSVRELTVTELSALIEATRAELDTRVARQRAGGRTLAS